MSCSECGVTTPVPGVARLVLSDELPAQLCSTGDGLDLLPGGRYVVATREGERLALVPEYGLKPLRPCADRVVGTVLREASAQEVERGAELTACERDALQFCRRRARERSLPLRPVSAVAPLDRDTLTVTYAAEERVDVRDLARDLSQYTRRRVDLKPIGVRDQAKESGGLGHCGRVLCCATFMSRFSSVTVRMAKAQNLALNPSRISGMCGRLMCCLAHEAPDKLLQRRRENHS